MAMTSLLSVLVASMVTCEAFDMKPFNNPETPYPQTAYDAYNLLKFTANRGPYSDRRGVGLNRDPPDGCSVDQVIMLARHGERWPSAGSFKLIKAAVAKVQKVKHATGPLSFVDDWEQLDITGDGWLDQETFVGPYSGLLDAYYHGVQYRRRYGHLYDGQSKLPLFISAFQRDADTGRKFGQGFLNWNYTDLAAVNFVLEQDGANTLSPTCDLKNGSAPTTLCADYTYYKEFAGIAKRLNGLYPGMNLTTADAFNLMEIVGYELNIRGSSPWVTVFTSEEWIAYEYYIRTGLYCTAGPGSVVAPIEGSLYLNGSRNLLVAGPKSSKLPLAFSFTHETDILKVLSIMGIDAPQNVSTYDATQVRYNSSYCISDLVPQGARFVLERLSCKSNASEPSYVNQYPQAFNSSSYVASTTNTSNIYVRVVINEAVVPLTDCADGPGASCNLNDFSDWVETKLQGNDFVSRCNITSSQPTEFTVFTNYSLSGEYNADSLYEPYDATTLNSTGQPISS